MRIEVYYPPYLTDGRRQPNFTVQENDWSYGGTYTITVELYEGTTDAMRVSMLAGEHLYWYQSIMLRASQRHQAHMATTWAHVPSSPPFRATGILARSLRRPTPMSLRLVGTSCSCLTALPHPTHNGSVLAVTLASLATGQTSRTSRFLALGLSREQKISVFKCTVFNEPHRPHTLYSVDLFPGLRKPC